MIRKQLIKYITHYSEPKEMTKCIKEKQRERQQQKSIFCLQQRNVSNTNTRKHEPLIKNK